MKHLLKWAHALSIGVVEYFLPVTGKEAIGHGIRANRSNSGAVSFDVLRQEAAHAPVQ
jgi:hypothetical protein